MFLGKSFQVLASFNLVSSASKDCKYLLLFKYIFQLKFQLIYEFYHINHNNNNLYHKNLVAQGI